MEDAEIWQREFPHGAIPVEHLVPLHNGRDPRDGRIIHDANRFLLGQARGGIHHLKFLTEGLTTVFESKRMKIRHLVHGAYGHVFKQVVRIVGQIHRRM